MVRGPASFFCHSCFFPVSRKKSREFFPVLCFLLTRSVLEGISRQLSTKAVCEQAQHIHRTQVHSQKAEKRYESHKTTGRLLHHRVKQSEPMEGGNLSVDEEGVAFCLARSVFWP